MTTYTRQCDGHPHRCPRSPQCGIDCHFNVADTAEDKAAQAFWASNPGYTHTLIEQPAPEVEDGWPLDWRGAGAAFVAVLVLALIFGVGQ